MSGRPHEDHTPIIALAALFLLHSPFTAWWGELALPWYALFLPWFAVIVLVFLNQRSSRR